MEALPAPGYRLDTLEPSITTTKSDAELQSITYRDALYDLKDHDMARWLLLHSLGAEMARIDPPKVEPFICDIPVSQKKPTSEERAEEARRRASELKMQTEREERVREDDIQRYMKNLGLRFTRAVEAKEAAQQERAAPPAAEPLALPASISRQR